MIGRREPYVPPLWLEPATSVLVVTSEGVEVSLSVAMPYLFMGGISDSYSQALIPYRKTKKNVLIFLFQRDGKSED